MEENKYEENFDMNILENMNYTDSNISDIIKRKIYEAGGTVTISLLDGKPCHIAASNDGRTFTSDKLNHYSIKLDFEVFDCIVELLRNSKNYKAPKGNAHGKDDKVGYGKCTSDTVMGTIALKYFKKNIGESTLDPVFVLAAILDWAGIAKNLRGYIQLNPAYL